MPAQRSPQAEVERPPAYCRHSKPRARTFLAAFTSASSAWPHAVQEKRLRVARFPASAGATRGTAPAVGHRARGEGGLEPSGRLSPRASAEPVRRARHGRSRDSWPPGKACGGHAFRRGVRWRHRTRRGRCKGGATIDSANRVARKVHRLRERLNHR